MGRISDRKLLEGEIGRPLSQRDFLALWGSRRDANDPYMSTARQILYAEMHRVVADARKGKHSDPFHLHGEEVKAARSGSATKSAHHTR